MMMDLVDERVSQRVNQIDQWKYGQLARRIGCGRSGAVIVWLRSKETTEESNGEAATVTHEWEAHLI